MDRYIIYQFDNDYRVVVDSMIRDFKDEESVKEYCSKKSWSGFSYFYERLIDKYVF